MTDGDPPGDVMVVPPSSGGAGGGKTKGPSSSPPSKAPPQAAAAEAVEKKVDEDQDEDEEASGTNPPARKRARKNEKVDSNDDEGGGGGADNDAEEGNAEGEGGIVARAKTSLTDALFGSSPAEKGGEGKAAEEAVDGAAEDHEMGEGSENDAKDDDKAKKTANDDDSDDEKDGDGDESDDGDDPETVPPKPSPSQVGGLFDSGSSSAFADRAERMRKSNMLLATGKGKDDGKSKDGGKGGDGDKNGPTKPGSKKSPAGAKSSLRRTSSTHVDDDDDDDEEEDDYGDEEVDSYGDEDDYGDDYGDDYDEDEDEEEAAEEREKMMAIAAIAEQNAREARLKDKAKAAGKGKYDFPDAEEDYSEDDYDYSDYDDEYYDEDDYGYDDDDMASPSPNKKGGKKYDAHDFSDTAILARRLRRRQSGKKTSKADALIGFDINTDMDCPDSWTSGQRAGVAASAASKKTVGFSSMMDDEDAEMEKTREATAAMETLFQEIGVLVLKSGGGEAANVEDSDEGGAGENDGGKGSMKAAAAAAAAAVAAASKVASKAAQAGSPSAPLEIADDSDDDGGDAKMGDAAKSKTSSLASASATASASASASAVASVAKGNKYGSGSEVEFVCSKKAPPSKAPPLHLIPPHLMEKMVKAAKEIEKEVCDRLDEKGEAWRPVLPTSSGDSKSEDNDDGDEKKDEDDEDEENMKMPSRETAAKEKARKKNASSTVETCNFRYNEVASRCPGRLDVRHRMDEAPFNDPRIVRNPILFPIIQSLLGGPDSGAALLYAGLIFSFPGSSDQPWHMDGAALFPEIRAWLDLPPYALNVFIPLEDVTDEVGPTEFLPASHLAARANSIDDDLLQWAVAESRRQALAAAAAAGLPPPPHLFSTSAPSGKTFSEEEWMEKHSVFAPLPKRGDALIYDYRACHRGTKNLGSSGRTRTMLYLMYARPWFREHLNFGDEKLFVDDDSGGGKKVAAAAAAGGGVVAAAMAGAKMPAAAAAAAATAGEKMPAAAAAAAKPPRDETEHKTGSAKAGDDSDLGDGKFLI